MLTLSQRLGTLDAKAKLATRTAKDGEEYSQLVFEVTELEVDETEVNALRSSDIALQIENDRNGEDKPTGRRRKSAADSAALNS